MGGIAGRCDALAGAVECQKSAGCLHLHFFAFIQRLHLQHDMQEIAEKFKEGLVNATELKSFCANLCCETYPIPEKVDEMVAQLHMPYHWPAMKEKPKSFVGKQRFGLLPKCVAEDLVDNNIFQSGYSSSPAAQVEKLSQLHADAAAYHADFHIALQQTQQDGAVPGPIEPNR